MILVVVAVLAQAPVDMTQLEASMGQYRFADVAKKAAALRESDSLSRGALLRLIEMQAISAGNLRQPQAAEEFFLELLTLDPRYVLGADQAPRVSTPFLAARQRAEERGALKVAEVTPTIESGRVRLIKVTLNNVAGMAKRLRFHVRGAADWATTTVPITVSELAVDGETVSWWVEVLGARGSQLLVLGTEAQPLVAQAPRADTPTAEVKPRLLPDQPPAVVTLAAGPSPMRITGGVLVGVGALAAGIGVVFGVLSQSSYSKITTAARDPAGVVTGISESEARSLLATGQDHAKLADGLFIGAATAGVIGIILWLVGAPVGDAPKVTQ